MKQFSFILVSMVSVALGSDPKLPKVAPSIDHIIDYVANEEGVDNRLIYALVQVESNGVPYAIHYNDGGSPSFGLGQIKYRSAKSVGFNGKKQELLNPFVNVRMVARLLKRYLKRYHGNVDKALRCYNLGHWDGTKNSEYSLQIRRLVASY